MTFCLKNPRMTSENTKCAPSICWVPKILENTTKTRVIIASSTCFVKPFSEYITSILILIFLRYSSKASHDKSSKVLNKFIDFYSELS